MESGYGRPRPSHNAALTDGGPGTPAGELLRRYWQPVGLSSELGDLPTPVRVYQEKVRQPWYPCREYGGLVFAYLGPLAELPVFPRYDIVEHGDGVVIPDGTSYRGPHRLDRADRRHAHADVLAVARPAARRPVRFPAARAVQRQAVDGAHGRGAPRMPSDKEAQVSQGPIAVHANEHLAPSDRGVIMTRRMLKAAIDALARGEDPPGIVRDPARDVVATLAGNAVVAAATERS